MVRTSTYDFHPTNYGIRWSCEDNLMFRNKVIYSCADICTDCSIYSRSQKKKVKKKSENDVNFKLFL